MAALDMMLAAMRLVIEADATYRSLRIESVSTSDECRRERINAIRRKALDRIARRNAAYRFLVYGEVI